jgi:hypothetical protein
MSNIWEHENKLSYYRVCYWFRLESENSKDQWAQKQHSHSKYFDLPETMSTIHDKYVIVPTDKTPNNIVLICKKHYIDCLKIELGWIARNVIIHIQLLRYQRRKSSIITCHCCLLFVFPWMIRIMIFPYCTEYQYYTSTHANNVISQELSSILPNLFLNF